MLTVDTSIATQMTNKKYSTANYPQYFFNEIKNFIKRNIKNRIEEDIKDITNDDLISYEEKRKIGENDSLISKLIREDSVEEFVSFINKTNFSLLSIINPSIFETNRFLINKKLTLIEYAAFYRSIQIFHFLYMNKVDLSSSLWIYAIHSLKA